MGKVTTFAARLQELLDKNGITKADLSRMTGINRSSITHYVKGDWEGKQDAVYAIAKAANVDEAWLMGYDVPSTRISHIVLRDDYSRTFREHLACELDRVRSYLAGDEPAMADYYELERLLESPGPLLLDDACRAADMIGQTMGYMLGEDDVESDEQTDTKKSPGPDESRPEDTLDAKLVERLIELEPQEQEKVDAFIQGLLAAREVK